MQRMWSRLVPSLVLLGACSLAGLTAEEAADDGVIEPNDDALLVIGTVADLQAQLPPPPTRDWQETGAPFSGKALAPGLELVKADQLALHLQGFALPPPKPELELLVTLAGGNNHESLFRLELEDAALAAAACQFLAALPAGRPAQEASTVPAVGTPMQLDVVVQRDPLLEPGKWETIPASSLLQDVATKRQFPALPFIFTGSQTVTIERELDGKIETVRYFGLASGRRGWAHVYDDPDGLLASPLPLAGDDTATVPAPAVLLPAGLPVTLVLTMAELPLRIESSADGILAQSQEQLVEAIQQAFAKAGGDTLRAAAVAVPNDVTDSGLIAARRAFLEAAVAAQVWVVPVFVWQNPPTE